MHPTHRAADGQGWSPGWQTHRCDLLTALSTVEGVDHIESLTLRIEELLDVACEAALVCAGALEVTTP